MRAKRAWNIFKLSCRKRSERKIFGKFCTFPPNSSKLKVGLFIFFPEEDKLFISSIFKVRIFISKKCQPPPPPSESNGRPLMWKISRNPNSLTFTFLSWFERCKFWSYFVSISPTHCDWHNFILIMWAVKVVRCCFTVQQPYTPELLHVIHHLYNYRR